MIAINRIPPDRIPQPLREIPQPPKELYFRGSMPDPDMKLITFVGSRGHTKYGREAVQFLIKGLAGYPVGIVSGLALGIDTLAHEYALEYGIPTYAFPGSGLSPSVLYPAANRGLAERIIESGGGLISELTPETKSAIWTFPARNRLMAGIADMVIIIEAAYDSGTMITAHTALEYGRTVGAVPGPIFAESSAGCNRLIKQGATPITCTNDILREIGMAESIPKAQNSHILASATDSELEIYNLLTDNLSKNEISEKLDIPVQTLGITLSMMELKGLILEEFGLVRRNPNL